MKSANECYRILGVTPGATPEQLKRAYRRLAKRWHPDRFANDPAARQVAEEGMKEVNAAYEVLRSIGASRQQEPRPSRGRPQPPPPRPEPGDQQKREAHSTKPSNPPGPGAKASPRRYRIPTGAVIMALLALGRLNSNGFFHKWIGSGGPIGQAAAAWPGSAAYQVPAQSAARARATAPAISAQQPTTSGTCFSLGSTKAEVRAVQGSPDKSSDGAWTYGTSRVYFLFERVVAWHSEPATFLKVRLTPCDVRAAN